MKKLVKIYKFGQKSRKKLKIMWKLDSAMRKVVKNYGKFGKKLTRTSLKVIQKFDQKLQK